MSNHRKFPQLYYVIFKLLDAARINTVNNVQLIYTIEWLKLSGENTARFLRRN